MLPVSQNTLQDLPPKEKYLAAKAKAEEVLVKMGYDLEQPLVLKHRKQIPPYREDDIILFFSREKSSVMQLEFGRTLDYIVDFFTSSLNYKTIEHLRDRVIKLRDEYFEHQWTLTAGLCVDALRTQLDIKEFKYNFYSDLPSETIPVSRLFINVMYMVIARYMLKLNTLPINFNESFDYLDNDHEHLLPFYLSDKQPVNKQLFSSFKDMYFQLYNNDYQTTGHRSVEYALYQIVINLDHVIENIKANKIRGAKALASLTKNKLLMEKAVNHFIKLMNRDRVMFGSVGILLNQEIIREFDNKNVDIYIDLMENKAYKTLRNKAYQAYYNHGNVTYNDITDPELRLEVQKLLFKP